MKIQNITQLDKESFKVISNSKKFKFPKITMWLHNRDHDFKIQYPLYVDIEKNYNTNITDDIYVQFLIGLGDYKEFIFNYRNDLELTLHIDYGDDAFIFHRYKFILLNIDKQMDTTYLSQLGISDLNKTNLLLVKGQCVDPIINILKQLTVSGVFRDYDLTTVIKFLYGKKLNYTKINGNLIDWRISIKDIDNTAKIKNIVVPTFTKLIKLANYFQDYDYGLYNGGCNTYIIAKDKSNSKLDFRYDFRIYPLYAYDRFEKEHIDKRIIFYNPSKVFAEINDKTFWLDGNDYKLVTTSIEIENEGVNKLINMGDSIATINPNYYLTYDNINVDPDNLNISTDINLNRIDDDNPFVNYIVNNKDFNPFRYRSQIIKNNTLLSTLQLRNIDDRIYKPGMLLKYVYNRGENVIERRGVLQYVYTSYNIVKKENASLMKFVLERKTND
jgi:hypothetical protein